MSTPTYLYDNNSPYKWVEINYRGDVDGKVIMLQIKSQIPEATDFRTEEWDSFGPLTCSFAVSGVRYWYG